MSSQRQRIMALAKELSQNMEHRLAHRARLQARPWWKKALGIKPKESK